MNPSYGDPANAAHGRARIPGPDEGYDDHAGGSYDAYDTYRDPGRPTGRAPGASGSANVAGPPDWPASGGRASVRPGDGYDNGYSAQSGRASVGGGVGGRASVGGASGSASVGSASVGGAPVGGQSGRASVGRGSAGRASVGSASVGGLDGAPTGRATVGRASVGGPAGPGGPGGPDGPGRDKGGVGPGGKKPRNKRVRRRNIILAGAASLIMLSGLVVVAGTYYFDSVKMPDQLPVPDQSTTIYYADGKTPMAKLGDQNRTIVTSDQIPKFVKDAVVATEDNTFYTNQGVDFKGVLRAAVNNVTGGSRQGASTITQQYARKMADLEGISYARKLREAVIAMKLNQDYSKDQIITAYLNTVYFGRGAYGIEAAAQAFFHKDSSQLNVGQAMVLAALIKQPEPDPEDPKGSPGYDPAYGLAQSQDRWQNYIKSNMVKLGFLKPADAAALKYPTDWIKPTPGGSDASQYGLNTPTGFIVHHVMDELSHQQDVKALHDTQTLKNGGFSIITTIDKKMEDEAIATADDAVKGSKMAGQPSNLQASLVSIKPGTGQVLAYYAGNNGSGLDYAGIYSDPVLGDGGSTGAHFPPGSTFKLYTLATALSQGISIDSYWEGPPSKEFPDQGRTKAHSPPGPVTNADGDGDSCPKNTQPVKYVCTLQLALQKSMNTVFFGVGAKVGAANIIDMCKAMGVEHLWAPVPDPDHPGQTVDKRFDLAQYSGKDLTKYFGTEISIGQYGTTVLDNANGVATLAARGVHADAHFVSKVLQGGKLVYQERFNLTKMSDVAHLTTQEIDDETWAMESVIDNGLAKNKLASGRKAAAKTGTWQYADTSDNSDAWYAGFTPDITTVVHVGSRVVGQPQIKYKGTNGKLSTMNGADLPGTIWKTFMDKALNGTPKKVFADPKKVGDPTLGNAQSPQPQAPPPPPDPGTGGGQQQCPIPQFCQQNGGGRGNGDGRGAGPPTQPASAPPPNG